MRSLKDCRPKTSRNEGNELFAIRNANGATGQVEQAGYSRNAIEK